MLALTMHRFEICSGDTLVGWSDLERGDPPMGCADGRFFPSPHYISIQAAVVSSSGSDQSDLRLSVRLAETGEVLDLVGGVSLLDFSSELGADEMEVSAQGLGYPRYGELFPHHVTAYEAMFKKAS
jgi:hypothetical protein